MSGNNRFAPDMGETRAATGRLQPQHCLHEALVSQKCLPLLLGKSPLLVNPHCEKEVSDTSTTKVSQSNLY